MPALFDFGISQEDPLTEQFVLGIRPGDRVLSVASAGEVPLSLLSMIEDIQIKAVDISDAQIKLCRFKLLVARHIEFPLNGQFLGYTPLSKKQRMELYHKGVRTHLSKEDQSFWDLHLSSVAQGVVNDGRFERYLKKIRFVANWFIGKKNLHNLIECSSIEDQIRIFDQHIASRKSLQLLFKLAFHPSIYKNRGLREQALIHAEKTTGERFYGKFQDFCISSLAAKNYFLQYFLTGNCIKEECYPEYLQPSNRDRLVRNLKNLELSVTSFQTALCEKEPGYYNKIHLSNLGDWLSEEQFAALLVLLRSYGNSRTKICYRYLQKNHFHGKSPDGFVIDETVSAQAERKDRFPFYGILSITQQDRIIS